MAAKLTEVSTPAQCVPGFLLIDLNLAGVSRTQMTPNKKPRTMAGLFETQESLAQRRGFVGVSDGALAETV